MQYSTTYAVVVIRLAGALYSPKLNPRGPPGKSRSWMNVISFKLDLTPESNGTKGEEDANVKEEAPVLLAIPSPLRKKLETLDEQRKVYT